MKTVTVFFSLMLSITLINTKCPVSVIGSLDYIIEHAVWRGWHQVIIYTSDIEPDCRRNILHLVKCLGINGIASAVNVNEKSRFSSFLGIIIFQSSRQTDSKSKFRSTINQLTEFKMNNAALDWLIVAKSTADYKTITEVMNSTNIRFDQNIVAVFPELQPQKIKKVGPCNDNFHYDKNTFDTKQKKMYTKSSQCRNKLSHACNKTVHELNYFKTSERLKNITRSKTIIRDTNSERVPLWRSSFLNNESMISFQAVKLTNISVTNTQNLLNNFTKKKSFISIHVIQLFKMQLNSTLFIEMLGTWSKERSMVLVKPPYPVERRNFMGEIIVVGRCNSSSVDPNRPDEDTSPTPVLLDDVLEFLTLRLNATSQIRYYPQLGYRTYEGVWTGLLGALMDNSVDIVLEPVTTVSSRQADVDLIFPIAKTMYNIYIRHQETSAVRDIFLAPFSPQLVICVVCVALMASIGLIVINRLTLHPKSKRVACIDAVIWSSGILCQQGSSWRPRNPAASVLLIVYLFFALVTYNAYAAFITSVLSVRVANVGSLSDVLLSSNIKIGYVKNGADQMFLMSTKDVQLNEFYIRGYSEAENLVSSTEEGLVRAAKQDYAFFSGQQAARTTIRSLSQARGRCALRELPVLSTRAQLAFPLSNDSPYARPLLVSLLRLRSGGVLSRLEAALVPRMPQCERPSGFASARAADVRTALLVIAAGLSAALILGLAEFSWKNRSKLKRKIEETFKEIFK